MFYDSQNYGKSEYVKIYRVFQTDKNYNVGPIIANLP